jgi:hypothetical protein
MGGTVQRGLQVLHEAQFVQQFVDVRSCWCLWAALFYCIVHECGYVKVTGTTQHAWLL